MPFTSIIEQITRNFIQAWNEKDLDKVSTFLASNIRLKSPNIIKYFPDLDCPELIGKEAVIKFWTILKNVNFFKMTLIDFNKSAKTINVKIDVTKSPIFMYATFVIDEYGKFATIDIEYRE